MIAFLPCCKANGSGDVFDVGIVSDAVIIIIYNNKHRLSGRLTSDNIQRTHADTDKLK